MIYRHYSEFPLAEWRWRNFSFEGDPKLACTCCGQFFYDPDAMDKLQRLRDTLGAPVTINSGHRCAAYNKEIGGAVRSRHTLEIAFDISIKGHDPEKLYAAAVAAGFTTFGFYETFLHADTRPGRRWFTKGGRKTWHFLLKDK